MRRRTAVFTAVLVLSIFLGRLTVLPGTELALVWPASGVGLLWVLRARARREVALAATVITVVAAVGNGLTGVPPVAAAGLGVANVTISVATWLLLGGGQRGEPGPLSAGVRRISELYRFLGACALGVAVSALVGMLALTATTADVTWSTGVAWWLRNLAAVVLVVGPSLLGSERFERPRRAQLAEGAVLVVLTVVTLVWVFGPAQQLPLAFVPLALVVWAGLRLPIPLAALEGALVATGALVLVRTGAGGALASITDPADRGLVLQAFMMLAAFLALVLATVRAQLGDSLAAQALARREAEDAVEDLRILVEALPVGLFVVERNGSLGMHNLAGATWLHGPVAVAPGQTPLEHRLLKRSLQGRTLAHDERPSVRALLGEHVSGERIISEDDAGRERIVSVDALPLHNGADGEPDRAVLVWQDVTEEHEHVQRLRRARTRSDRLISDAPHGVVVVDATGHIQQANRAFATMFGRTEDDCLGAPVWALAPGLEKEARRYLDDTVRAAGELVESEWTVPDGPSGLPMTIATSSRHVTDHLDGDEILINVVDVSERRRYEERLSFLADHDVLTGLPNRRRFEESLSQHQAVCARYGPRGALLLIDLDHFKEVNDTLGHAAGDHLIATTGAILRDGVRQSDLVARLGGDEFAVLLPEADDASAETVAAHLVEQIREHCASLDGVHRRVTASIGVLTFVAAAARQGDVLALADMLMYDAKDAGRDGYVLLTSEAHRTPRLGARMEWRSRIEHAIENDLFELHLQPILDVAQGRVTQAESLVRLRDDDGTLIPPGRFVYVAELTGLAPALDSWVLRHSIAMLADLQRRDPEFVLEVNISAQSIGHPDVEAALVAALEEYGVAPSTLVLEVTETAAVRDVAAARGFGERLRNLGTLFALDDFGAGYGSFYYLKHLVFDYVKIDGEFVTDAHRSPMDRQLLRSIIDVARNLGKGTVAEFVTDRTVFELVRELGVDYAQGYYIGRPVPLVEFVAAHLSQPVPARGLTAATAQD
ncbi:bifunctional diguanylate cyclase/phosphodiesterase [Phycicoccus duodecadis]|uniref:PAS domain S-box-containing protein/diguanylate cyclase (GGDEF)-like protein n=1 Tax=Phycicoccus duodecadis TaxID=173053 RepID=A0A2N3YI92_9MICO|nr:EAL domain-containing protein [Phycicoccus duodecadis]PKW26561.1 PAS domain S-box-containing protein/diguanylate cyclase (GGDEF)-like protein [Phycicoccus duodecadis]